MAKKEVQRTVLNEAQLYLLTISSYDDLQSRTIDWLRFPLALFVIFIHSFGSGSSYIADYGQLTSIDVYNIVRISFSHVICQVAVPAFYCISGYLFFS